MQSLTLLARMWLHFDRLRQVSMLITENTDLRNDLKIL